MSENWLYYNSKLDTKSDLWVWKNYNIWDQKQLDQVWVLNKNPAHLLTAIPRQTNPPKTVLGAL